MKRLSTVLKKTDNYNLCGYLYREGVLVVKRVRTEGADEVTNYWLPTEIKFSDDRVDRVVLHDINYLRVGIPKRVEFCHNNSSPAREKKGLKVRLTRLQYEGLLELCLEETQYSPFESYFSSEISVQGDLDYDRQGTWLVSPLEYRRTPYVEGTRIEVQW